MDAPSPSKKQLALDPAPLLWPQDVHPAPTDACREPNTSVGIQARRDRAEKAAAEVGSEPARPSEVDVWPLVIRHNIRNVGDENNAHEKLIKVAKECCSPSMFRFPFRIRAKLPQLINDIWTWETIDERLELSSRSRDVALHQAFCKPCCCDGEWGRHLAASFALNNIDAADLGHHIYLSLQQGRAESVPVIVLAGQKGGEGKSLVFYPLPAVIGQEYIQPSPAKGSFPLLGIESKKIGLLEEWRFSPAILPLSVQLLWMEGKPVPVARPQGKDEYSGHLLYTGTAPLFVTTPLKRINEMEKEVLAAEQDGGCSEMSMIFRRCRIYKFTAKAPKPERQIPQCGHCFASFVFEAEEAWSKSHSSAASSST